MLAMISQPMGGLYDEDIERERSRIISILDSHNIFVQNTLFSFPEDTAKHMGVYYLAKSLEVMADVDLVYFCRGWERNRGCRIEYMTAIEYGLPIFIEQPV